MVLDGTFHKSFNMVLLGKNYLYNGQVVNSQEYRIIF